MFWKWLLKTCIENAILENLKYLWKNYQSPATNNSQHVQWNFDTMQTKSNMIYVSINRLFVVQNIILHYSPIKGSGNLKTESGNTMKAIIFHLKIIFIRKYYSFYPDSIYSKLLMWELETVQQRANANTLCSLTSKHSLL